MSNDNVSLDDILSGKNWEPVLGGGGGGDAIKLEVGDEFIGTYKGTDEVKSNFSDKPSKLHKFTQLDGTPVVIFGKGNMNYLLDSVVDGQLVKIERHEDEKMKNGFMSSTFRVYTAN